MAHLFLIVSRRDICIYHCHIVTYYQIFFIWKSLWFIHSFNFKTLIYYIVWSSAGYKFYYLHFFAQFASCLRASENLAIAKRLIANNRKESIRISWVSIPRIDENSRWTVSLLFLFISIVPVRSLFIRETTTSGTWFCSLSSLLFFVSFTRNSNFYTVYINEVSPATFREKRKNRVVTKFEV